jgi:hypothetical protein
MNFLLFSVLLPINHPFINPNKKDDWLERWNKMSIWQKGWEQSKYLKRDYNMPWWRRLRWFIKSFILKHNMDHEPIR